MNEDQIKTLCQYFSHGEVVFIGPYSGAFRPITKIEGNWITLNNDNKINLTTCEPTDFGILTRITL